MSHFAFVLAAYAAAALTVAGLVVWVRLDGAAQRRALAELGEPARRDRGEA